MKKLLIIALVFMCLLGCKGSGGSASGGGSKITCTMIDSDGSNQEVIITHKGEKLTFVDMTTVIPTDEESAEFMLGILQGFVVGIFGQIKGFDVKAELNDAKDTITMKMSVDFVNLDYAALVAIAEGFGGDASTTDFKENMTLTDYRAQLESDGFTCK